MYIADTLSRAYTTDTTVDNMETELADAVYLVLSNGPASDKRMREIRELQFLMPSFPAMIYVVIKSMIQCGRQFGELKIVD